LTIVPWRNEMASTGRLPTLSPPGRRNGVDLTISPWRKEMVASCRLPTLSPPGRRNGVDLTIVPWRNEMAATGRLPPGCALEKRGEIGGGSERTGQRRTARGKDSLAASRASGKPTRGSGKYGPDVRREGECQPAQGVNPTRGKAARLATDDIRAERRSGGR